MLEAGNAVADPRACERQADAPMAEGIQPALPPEHNRNQEPGRPRDEDIAKDQEVGQNSAERDENGQRLKCTKKRPGDKLPGV